MCGTDAMSWINAIPWIVAVVGWFATHLFSEARERRKEVRAQIDKILDRLFKLEETARQFHTGVEFDYAKSLEIISEIDRVERAISRITRYKIDEFVPTIIHHRRAITLLNFDSSIFVEQKSNSEILTNVSNATKDLEDELDIQYNIRYPSRFPYFTFR
jgi:hypothetical protein